MNKIIIIIVNDIKNGCSINEILKKNNLTLNKYILIKSIYLDNLDERNSITTY